MSPKTMQRIAKPLLFIATLIWGATYFVTKNALDVTPVFFLQSIRFTTGTLILSLLCWKNWKTFTRDYLWRGECMGLIMFLGYAIQTHDWP